MRMSDLLLTCSQGVSIADFGFAICDLAIQNRQSKIENPLSIHADK